MCKNIFCLLSYLKNEKIVADNYQVEDLVETGYDKEKLDRYFFPVDTATMMEEDGIFSLFMSEEDLEEPEKDFSYHREFSFDSGAQDMEEERWESVL